MAGSSLVSLLVSKSSSVACTKETVLGLQQVDLPSHLQSSEQASCADEQMHLCEEHGLSLLQLQLINLRLSEMQSQLYLVVTIGNMHLMVLQVSNQTQVDPALMDHVASFPNASFKMSPLYILSKCFRSRRKRF